MIRASQIFVEPLEDLFPRFGCLDRPVAGPINSEKAVAGAIVSVELVRLAVLLEQLFGAVDILRGWRLVVIAEYAEQRAAHVGKLSGGNIQKVLLARELTGETRLAIFNKPTYGLDLHNTRLARQRIAAAAEKGTATIVISTELDELMELCDRVAVLYQGRLQGIVENSPGAEERIGLMMTGGGSA